MSLPIPTHPTGQVLAPHPVRSLFLTDPWTVKSDGIANELRRIGVTHLEMQIYHRDGPAAYSEWFNNEWAKVGYCTNQGFRIIGLGDCAFRTPYRQDEEMVRYVARNLRDSGIVDGIEMVDEVHPDPSEYQPEEYIRWWREEGGPPIAWPGMMPRKWETDALSDYTSRYWPAYLSDDLSVNSIYHQMYLENDYIRTDRPWNMLTWCCAPSYNGRMLVYAGVSPQSIIAQVWIAMALGASGVRMYAYDAPFWRASRAAHAPGQQQTGSAPGDDRWDGVAAAFQTLKLHDADLRKPVYESIKSGPFLWGRRGDAPNALVWAINVSNNTQVLPRRLGTMESGSVKWWTLMDLLRT